MKKILLMKAAAVAALMFLPGCPMLQEAQAQLSSNPDKFLGNITTRYNVDAGGGVAPYWQLWNQITPENESKWGSVEGTRNSYNWGCDRPFNYAIQHNFPYKFHALVWGAQYPNWLSNLSIKERYQSIVKWFNAVKNKYATLPLIDVVNEAVGMHQNGNPMMKESLGGGGKTGYDWLIKAFEMAYERWPDAILIYNDYNTFQHDTNNYLELVRTLRDYGAPVDAYGCQSHDVDNISVANLKSSMNTLQNGLKMPMYITELDVNVADDNQQKQQYQNIFPIMWEAEYCAGVTIWGYIHGATWVDNSGLIKNGQDRPAMTWLRQYMETDAAKNAVSPFPGMKKEASIYVHPLDLKVSRGDVLPIKVRASMATKTIEKMELYVGTELIATMTEAPYIAEYQVPSNASAGWKTLKAVATCTDGSTYERYSRINVLSSTTIREPYNETIPEIPGTINATEYDKGAAGVSYNNASRSVTTATKDDGWMEYTVDVKEEGIYSMDVEVAATKTGGAFHLSEYGFDDLTYFSDIIEVPKTGSSSSDFQTMHIILQKPFTVGQHRLCLNIDKGGFFIKSMSFRRYEKDTSITVTISSLTPSTITLGESTTINVTARSMNSTIASVQFFSNDMLIGTATEEPYSMEYTPAAKGNYSITAIAIDAEGKENVSAKKTLKVSGKRMPYNTLIQIPGTFQAENFDKGGEGLTFHDSNDNNEGDSNYRSDAEGVDFVKGNNGVAIGYTNSGEWLEYSVNVNEPGEYECIATVSSGTTGSGFTLALVKYTSVINLCKINVPQTGNNDWGTYKTVTQKLSTNLPEGEQILRITIDGSSCNIDKIQLKCTKNTGVETLENDEQKNGTIWSLSGQKVRDTYRGIVIQNGKKFIRK